METTHERIRAAGEVALGGLLSSATFWGPFLDNVQAGLHFIILLTGAIVGVHGVWRIVRSYMHRKHG